MKNNIYTAIPDWFNKLQSQSTDNTSTTATQTTIIGGGGSISMSVHNLFIKSDTTITIDDFTISDLFVTDQITDTENWLTTPLLHTLPNTEVSVTTAAQLLYIGAYDKNNNQIKLYQFSEAISTVVIPENCYYLRASSNKTNTDLTIKYVGLNNFDETQLNKLESSSFQNFLTLVEGDEKGVITNSVLNLSLVFQNPLYYTLDKAGNVLISIDRDALFSQSENPTDDRYVTTVANSIQDILSSKNFKEGLSINGIEIVERNGFLYIKGNLATTGGITAYADDPDDPGSGGGLPGGGAIGDIVITGSGNALVDASLSEDHSVITFTKGWLVDAESDQSITGIKDFINGLKLDGQLIKIVDGVLFLDCSIAATGGITAYATMPGEGSSSIMDQLVVDTEYFIITEEGVLTIVPGSVGGISNIYVTGNGNALTTATLSEDGKTISFTKDKTFADDTEIKRIISEFKNEVNEQLKRFVTLDTEQEITAVKHFIEGVTIGSNKHKFYEKDGVLWLEGDIAITGGVTTYATGNVDVSTIMDGVAVDEITITKGNDNVLRIKDAGAGSSFDENAMWSALSGSSDNQINKSHLTTALDGYATQNWVIENYATKSELSAVSNKLNDFLEGSDTDEIINKWKELEAFLSGMAETDNLAEILETKADKKYVDSTFVTLATKQTITGEKTFSSVLNTAAIKASGEITTPSLAASDYVTIAGIKLRKLEDGALILEGNLALTGALTMYASNGQSFDTIYDGLPIDNDTIYWQEVDGSRVLKAREGSGSSFDKSAMWTALAGSTTEQINKSHLTTALTGYATESWVSEKNYAVKATTLAGYGITDGINAVSVTGTGNAVTAASISGHTLTLTKGSTFSLNGHKHAWDDITSGKPSTLSGYGITDAYTKTDADSRYVNVAGDTMTGNLSVKFSGRTDQINLFHSTTTNKGGISLTDTDKVVHAFHLTTTNLIWKGRTVWDSGNDGSGSGMDADTIDGIHANGLLTALTTSSATNLSITVGGTTKSITDLYAYASTKLETARSLWGNNFDGTASISGTIQFTSNVGKWLLQTKRSDNTQINGIKTNGSQMCTYFGDTKTMQFGSDKIYSYVDFRAEKDLYINGIRLHKTSDGVITLEGNLAVTGGITTYAIDPVSASTIMDGVVVDGTTIKKENGKLVAVGGGEAGSVAWGNITGKPSVFSTNIANITDLHSSWDAVLKAQKPNWLTAVSIATISDLHANWDALLKAAPSAYVTRWPSFAEVTSKPTTLAGYGITDAPTKTGSGASGTWGIAITGNAATASKWATARTITLGSYLSGSVSLDGSANVTLNANVIGLTSQGNKTAISGTTMPATGVRLYQVYDNGYPTRFGNLLSVKGDGCGELLLAWKNTNRIYYRSKSDVSTEVWQSWSTVAFLTDNVASASKLANKRYLWGQGFDGTTDVTGIIEAYNGIQLPYRKQIQTEYGTLLTTGYNSESGYNDFFQLTAVGANKAARSLVGGNTGKLVWEGHQFIMTIYDGGWYMSDNIWMRTYNHKGVVCNDLWVDSRVIFGGNAEFGGNTTPNGVVFYDRTRAQRGIFAWYNDHFYMAKFENNKESTGYVAIYEDYVGVGGNLLVSGGGTFYSSDIRYKSIIQQIKLSLLDIAKAPSFVYHWNKKEMICDRLNIGGSAQYTQTILPWAVEEKNNLLTMDYATVAYTFAVHTARHLLDYETKTDKEIRKLKNRIKYLEKQLKSLHYEEANIVDN